MTTLYYKCRNCQKDFTKRDNQGWPAKQLAPALANKPNNAATTHECGAECDDLIGIADLIAVSD